MTQEDMFTSIEDIINYFMGCYTNADEKSKAHEQFARYIQAVIKARDQIMKPETPAVIDREQLLTGWGHGWQESHLIGDDEDPECFTLTECVWINGYITDEDDSYANANSDYWREHYNKQYGIRIWAGDRKPTEDERKAMAWE